MADELMIEVTGSAKTAESALDRVTKKLETLKATFDKLAPSVKDFTEKMESIASSSKAISSLKKITESTQRSALSAKDAESRMAMYQARLDRATLSMNKTRVASERLAAAQRKLIQASGIDAANQDFLKNYKYTGFSDKASSYLPTPDTTPSVTPIPGSSRLASSIVDAQNTAQKAAFNINTTPALTKLQEVQAYIDSLTPSITGMSAKAQVDFQNISTKLTLLAQQIDNQRAMWSKLASAQGQAASKFGENSNQALKLEKQMLSADSAMSKLIDKQDKLKAQMSQIAEGTDKASSGFSRMGKSAHESAKKSVGGLTKLLRMVKSVAISLLTFKALTAIQQGFQTGLQNIAQASSQANYYLSAIATSSLYMKNSLGAALMPVIQALTPYITWFTDALANLFNTIGMLTARIFNGATSITIAKKANVDYAASLGNSNKAAKELQRTIAGFDEINALSKPSSDSSNGLPDVKNMFETVQIPKETLTLADKIKEKLKALQPLFKGLQEVFSGAWSVIKDFAENHLYKWLVNIGDWMQNHPNTMYWLGKGLGYVAIGLAAFKGIKWLGEITGISKLVGWLWNLTGATKGVTTAFGGKNKSLDAQTKKTKIETSALKNLLPWLAGAGAAALGLGAAFDKVKMPSLNPGSQTSSAPALAPAIAPAIDTKTYFEPSLKDYLSVIVAPAFALAAAPALLLNQFLSSRSEYQAEITPPTLQPAIAPAIDTDSKFEPSLENAKSLLSSFQTSTLKSLETWGKLLQGNFGLVLTGLISVTAEKRPQIQEEFKSLFNNVLLNSGTWGTSLMRNFGSIAAYIPLAFASPLTAASKMFASFLNNTSKNSVSWADGIASASASAMSTFYNNVVSGLKSSFDAFSEFMVKTGKTALVGMAIYAPKFAEYTQKGIAIAGATALTIATGGATAPALSRLITAFADGGLVTGATLSLIGEGADHEAVLPLNKQVFSSLAQGIVDNGGVGANGDAFERVVSEIQGLRSDISNLDLNIKLYANNREIAEAANAGNRVLDRARHPVASST